MNKSLKLVFVAGIILFATPSYGMLRKSNRLFNSVSNATRPRYFSSSKNKPNTIKMEIKITEQRQNKNQRKKTGPKERYLAYHRNCDYSILKNEKHICP